MRKLKDGKAFLAPAKNRGLPHIKHSVILILNEIKI